LVTYVPLHTIGKVERRTVGGDHWKFLYIPPQANNWTQTAKRWAKIITAPLIFVFYVIMGIVQLTTYNGALAIWFWLCIAIIVLYQAHVNKDSTLVEPAMTLLWIAFIVNVFEIWFCAPATGRFDTVGNEPSQLRKLELEHETRLPKPKVRRLVLGFGISLALIFISAVAMTTVTNALFRDVEFFGIDKSWESNYKENRKYILCEKKEGRRMLEEADNLNFDFETGEARSSYVLKGKYSGEYDALCRDNNFHAMSVAIAFCTIDWFFLLILAIYWHTYDQYQTKMKFDPKSRDIIWQDVTFYFMHSVPSKITWLGRIIGRHLNDSVYVFMHTPDATKLHRYLTENVPWFAHLNINQPGARELMPR